METIEIDNIKDPTHREIILHLSEREKSLFGEIAKDLNLSVNKAQEAVHDLLDQGILAYRKHSKYLQLIVKIR